jgi:preprotein translocase subunit SecE
VSPLTLVGVVVALAAAAALVVWRERVKGMARDTAGFVGEVRAEVKKVTWPDREQLKNATLVIIGFVLVMAVVIGVMDIVLQAIFVSVLPRWLG